MISKSFNNEGVNIFARDFNQANMKKLQHTDFATRGTNKLIATSKKNSPCPEPSPWPIWPHCYDVMTLANRPLLARTKQSLNQVRVWAVGAMPAVQDCFDSTDWSVFRKADKKVRSQMLVVVEIVSRYIQKCMEDVTTKKNYQSWRKSGNMDDRWGLLTTRNVAFKFGDTTTLRMQESI